MGWNIVPIPNNRELLAIFIYIPFYIESYIRLFSSSTLPAKVYLHTAYTIHPRNIHSSHLSNHLLQEVFNPLQIVNNQFMIPYI